MTDEQHLIHRYLRSSKRFPHVWWPGCGIGIALGALVRAIDSNGYRKTTSSSSRASLFRSASVYLDFNTLHTRTVVRSPSPPASSWQAES
jgi:2-oxoglutarate ferredoxin oxidoreductase subunit beta